MRFEFWAVAVAVRAAAGKLRFRSLASQLYTQIIKLACQPSEFDYGVLYIHSSGQSEKKDVSEPNIFQ